MPTVRTKIVETAAVQWTGDLRSLIELEPYKGSFFQKQRLNEPSILVLEGRANGAVVEQGDWVLKGTDSFLYPCKRDAFEKIYEIIEGVSVAQPPDDAVDADSDINQDVA